LAAFAAVAISAAAATAQSKWAPDGDTSPGPTPTPNTAVFASCGAITLSVIRSQNAAIQTSSTSFATVPGASTNVTVNGPRCIKVLFTGETACRPTGDTDLCYMRALVDGIQMNPADSQRAIDSESNTARGHAFAWYKVVNAGTHNIVVQGRVADSSTDFHLDDWTFDVEVSRR
jgi:hypothetical protein